MADLVLLEDANDLCLFFEATARTVLRQQWAEESIAAVQEAQIEAMF
jgi:hypothetical protein